MYSLYFIIIVYLVLSYYLLYSSSGLSTDVFHIKTNIHTDLSLDRTELSAYKLLCTIPYKSRHQKNHSVKFHTNPMQEYHSVNCSHS